MSFEPVRSLRNQIETGRTCPPWSWRRSSSHRSWPTSATKSLA